MLIDLQMKKISVFVVLVVTMAVACTKKMAPSGTPVTQKTTDNLPQKPDEETDTRAADEAKEKGKTYEPVPGNTDTKPANAPEKKDDIMEGRLIFTSKCSKCHATKEVSAYSASKWQSILKQMVPKAGLNATEEAQLRAFISLNTKG